MLFLFSQKPCCGGSDEECEGRDRGGEAEGGEKGDWEGQDALHGGGGCWGASCDEEGEERDEDSEEIRDVDGIAQKDADGNNGEGLPVGDAVGERIGLIEAAEACGGLPDERAAKEAPGKEPDEVERPVEVGREFV